MKPENYSFNNILNLFAITENDRMNNYLSVSTNDCKIFNISHRITNKELDKLQFEFDQIGHTGVSEELLKYCDSSAEEIIYNEALKGMLQNLALELVKKGVILLKIEDSKYEINTSELTLTMVVVNPTNTAKRLDVRKKNYE